MARSFDLETIAEGIESETVKNYLQREMCDEGQGYFFGKPMPAPQFEQLLGLKTATKAIA
jgi:EAL domain-containing protein (putative c-di-GMP-specific phosphodiesterase class I)